MVSSPKARSSPKRDPPVCSDRLLDCPPELDVTSGAVPIHPAPYQAGIAVTPGAERVQSLIDLTLHLRGFGSGRLPDGKLIPEGRRLALEQNGGRSVFFGFDAQGDQKTA